MKRFWGTVHFLAIGVIFPLALVGVACEFTAQLIDGWLGEKTGFSLYGHRAECD